MRRISTLLIDDEKGALKALTAVIEMEMPELEIVGSACSVDEGYDKILELNPELLFLDIKLGSKSGFDLLNRFDEIDFEVVFVTAYHEYAIDAFNKNALSYLLKPISFDSMAKIKGRLIDILQGKRKKNGKLIKMLAKEQVALPLESGVEFMFKKDIVYFQAEGSYCKIFLSDSTTRLISKPLNYLLDKLNDGNFIRCHRSYVINQPYLKKWEKAGKGRLILTTGTIIPISANGRRLLDEILEY